jgi:hypothetical protein
MRNLACLDRPGLGPAGLNKAQWERWNGAWVRRWHAEESGLPYAHEVVRYFATAWDGRFLCVRCGRHYVRRCDLVRNPCPGQPQIPRASQALEDAYAGRPLHRQAVNSRALFPSGAPLSAAGARIQGFDPDAVQAGPRPVGPAHPDSVEIRPRRRGAGLRPRPKARPPAPLGPGLHRWGFVARPGPVAPGPPAGTGGPDALRGEGAGPAARPIGQSEPPPLTPRAGGCAQGVRRHRGRGAPQDVGPRPPLSQGGPAEPPPAGGAGGAGEPVVPRILRALGAARGPAAGGRGLGAPRHREPD